ncbi:Crp/Fnr family transcriptional regulator [Parabacteroides bouchesdurhonensis]|uniref:Crp/Fnr family transcriptional regulator n=1 Tax=Parabacteroides bouchesdurhonensis TaxID=1936995 RepID=UPI000E544A96|nr:Crp/Fnr family transcriptional regulator [Parabacteroides bouchesdurhonensis]RHJ94993.1 Crp/Fnr family transcriptional regulator [Bacteroides sp. AM07-16]
MEPLRDIAEKIIELSYPPQPISNEAVDKFASILIRTNLKKNTMFLREGEVCTQIGYVEKGMIRQFYYKNNKDLTEHFACEHSIFICIESFLRQRPARLMVEALENTVLYGIPHDPLLEMAAEDYEIEMIYRGLLEDSLILSQRKTDSFRFETANERYNRLLKEHPEIIRRAPLSHIASYLLMTPETLSRVRASLQ